MKKTRKISPERAKRQLAQVKAAFILKGTSFHVWCNENNIDHGNATKAMLGIWAGEKGKELRNQIIQASKEKTARPEAVNTEQSMTA